MSTRDEMREIVVNRIAAEGAGIRHVAFMCLYNSPKCARIVWVNVNSEPDVFKVKLMRSLDAWLGGEREMAVLWRWFRNRHEGFLLRRVVQMIGDERFSKTPAMAALTGTASVLFQEGGQRGGFQWTG